MRSSQSVADLLLAHRLEPGERLTGAIRGHTFAAIVEADGKIRVGDAIFRSPSLAANSVLHRNTNGWTFWRVTRTSGQRSLAELRAELAS